MDKAQAIAGSIAGALASIGQAAIGQSAIGRFTLTPLHLEIVLHYNSRAYDIENLEAPAVAQYISQLRTFGILQLNTLNGSSAPVTRTYELSAKGQAYLESLLVVPLPVQKWETHYPQS